MPIPTPSMSTRSNTIKPAQPAQIAALWFGIQLIWGAVLGISLQARCVAACAELGARHVRFDHDGRRARCGNRAARRRSALRSSAPGRQRTQWILSCRRASRRGCRDRVLPCAERAGRCSRVRRAATCAQHDHRSVSGDRARYDAAVALWRCLRMAGGICRRGQRVRRGAGSAARRGAVARGCARDRAASRGGDHARASAWRRVAAVAAARTGPVTRTLVNLFISRAFVFLGLLYDAGLFVFLRCVGVAAALCARRQRAQAELCILDIYDRERTRRRAGRASGGSHR